MSGMPPMTPEQMANMPLMPNPNGLPPNFDDPNSNGPQAIIILSIFLGLATLIVFLRVVSRIRIVKRTGWDDASAVAALLCVATMVGLITFLINLGVLGPHAWDVRLVTFMQPKVSGSLISVQIIGGLANFFAKLSILLFVRRLFPRVASPKTSYFILFGIIANVIAYTIITIYTCAVCVPRVGGHGFIPAKCSGDFQSKLGTGSAAVNAALDCYVFMVSVPSLWMLQMPMRRKLSVVGILAIGLAACGLSLATLAKRARNNPMDDPTRKQTLLLVLAVLEPSVAIITASLPALPSLWVEISTNGAASLRRLFSRISSTTSLNSSRNRSEHNKIDEESSLKSLQTHNLTRTSDAERGYKGQYNVTSKDRPSF